MLTVGSRQEKAVLLENRVYEESNRKYIWEDILDHVRTLRLALDSSQGMWALFSGMNRKP